MIGALIERCGYGPDEPIVVGLQRGTRPPEFECHGRTRSGEPLTSQTRVYAASLSKQFLGACTALLVRADDLDVMSPLSVWLPDLPRWANEIQVQHLISHTAGLPMDVEIDTGQDRTAAGILSALAQLSELCQPPGRAFEYSNVGYVCLAAVVERAARAPLPHVAESLLFRPLGMVNSLF